ncbi:T9SS type B sorting domain-containing protein [Polaribacter sargassicola]|uniref:T9SS type B sorting domain-containing protein n=1 Tax=Polaribacter sargassicola TaxID=2836891 RepID=UPI001F3D2C81|nr:T9SS type B sorting domain-containing protein [Polaribacter sp. DS7-9]MCG1037004.1 T9SS type B sorting domain-containing protein [Polaribacter sp. DS7-9]
MLNSKLSIFFTLLLLICVKNLEAQLSKKHFIPPLTYAENGNANPENQYFYISTPSNQNVTYTITQIGSSNNITGVVTNTSPKEIYIGIGNSQLFVDSNTTSSVYNNKGYIIEASDVIYVSIRVLGGSNAQAGALVSKGASALGTSFRAGMFTNEAPQDNYLSFISVMATENNTSIEFSDLPTGISIKNYSGTLPISVNLNEGESYVVAVNSDESTINRDALIGTLIKSDKPIVTNIGSANGSFHNGNGRDYGIDQIVGEDKIGTEYIFVKGDGSNNWENVLIVANEDNTEIFINENTTATTTLNAGDYYLIEGNIYNSNGNMYVQTSRPTFAYQGVGANNNEANQGLFFVPPLSCENRGKVDNIPNIEDIGSTIFTGGVSIVTNTGSEVKINGALINTYSGVSGPFTINTANSGTYDTYKVTNLSGNISIESSGELYCAYFNQNNSASSGAFYSGFPSAPEINFNTVISTLGNCIPNITLEAANTELFDGGIKWEYYNETTSTWDEKSTDNSYKPLETEPGRYRLVGKIVCTNTEFISVEIPISICPDDYDSDGIIDNIDVDIDNDGILNCDESIGNANLDITDFNNPNIIFSDNSTNNNISVIFDASSTSNTFTGDSNGNFTSIINPTTDSYLEYELSFTDKINFKFTQNSTLDHVITNEEYFILKVDLDKNVTLLDPDDQLLIYNLSTEEYESGITYISASEIQFKYKSNTTATASTFQFLANQITQLDFKHQSTGITTSSTFDGNIQITCYSRDSDGDGIEDMFDLDSDNDGIPDFYESTAQDVSLTNTDTNLDGLDDLFNTITANQDTDEDGIPNYLDVDSDNDGIYDIIETDNGNLDSDNDGIIDTANSANVGVNGLLNTLETYTDSGILKTSIKNSDTSSIVEANRDNLFDFVDLDSDGDNCFDVIEAGFTGNGFGKLDPNPLDVDDNGKVKNSNGYTTPNTNYLNSAPIIITNFSDATFCENDTNQLEIDSNADEFQWQISTDNGLNFTDILENTIIDGTTISNVTSSKLLISNTSTTLDNYQFKVLLKKEGNSCNLITPDAIILTVNSTPEIINSLVVLQQCTDNPNENTIVNLTEAEVNISTDSNITFEYYETETDAINGDVSKIISEIENYPVTSGYAEAGVRVISEQGCYSIAKIVVTASYVNDVIYDKTFEECDDFLDVNGNDSINNSETDGITFFDFSIASQEIINTFPTDIQSDIEVFFYETSTDRDAAINEIVDISHHRNNKDISYAFNQTIYIKIKNKNNNNCEGIGQLYLKTNEIPSFSVEGEAPNEPIIICAQNIPYILKATTLNDYDYTWTKDGVSLNENTNEIQITEGGNYTVTAYSKTGTFCSKERTITVLKSDFEILEESYVTIYDDISSISANLSILINIPTNPTINEEFQYALKNENGVIIRNYQDSNIFEDIEGGIYTILVENKNGCGSSELVVSVIQFPKFFTPNGDGKNDTWHIKGLTSNLYLTSDINIFNRYGKLISKIPVDSNGWDGTYNGKILPSDDYWFTVTLTSIDDTKKIINKKGHFSLLRK